MLLEKVGVSLFDENVGEVIVYFKTRGVSVPFW